MDSNSVYSKYRPPNHSNRFYQNPTFQRSARQTIFTLPDPGGQSVLLWKKRSKQRGRVCSFALTAAVIVVLFTVLCIAGLALYMGAIRGDEHNSLLTLSGSARITQGDRFASSTQQEQTHKYKQLFELLFRKSVVGAGFVSCAIDRFDSDGVTIYFKLVLAKKKLSRFSSIAKLEKQIRDILLGDALSKRPILRNVRFDPRNIRITISDNHHKTKLTVSPKDNNNNNNNTNNNNSSLYAFKQLPKEKTKKPDIKPVIRGTFQISKTEADITEKKSDSVEKRVIAKPSKPSVIVKTDAASNLFKLQQDSKTTTTTTSATSISTTFMTPPTAIPWVPIQSNFKVPGPNQNHNIFHVLTTVSPIQMLHKKQPVFTSFTNPSLTFHSTDMEILGSSSIYGHPLPVNKIAEITQTPIKQSTNTLNSFIKIDQPIAETEISTEPFLAVENYDDEITIGQGLAEVIESDEDTLIKKQSVTHVPLVTLIPVKSNSGIGRPLRPKPQLSNGTEHRSFPTDSFLLNAQLVDERKIKTEVVTSVSTTMQKVKMNRNHLPDYVAVEVLNFETENPLKPYDLLHANNVNNKTEILEEALKKLMVNYTRGAEKVLTEENLKHLSEISKVRSNSSKYLDGSAIYNKVNYVVNQAGLEVLTKPLNKIIHKYEGKNPRIHNRHHGANEKQNITSCKNNSVICGDGQCLPDTTRCNQLIDCNDGTDEKHCNCADYLRAQFLSRKICDGVLDCWDFSDENLCEWCKVGHHVCSNSKLCIDPIKICDGIKDCPNGDDERQCVGVAPNIRAASDASYYPEGFLMVRKNGEWGKLCVDSFDTMTANLKSNLKISDLGKAVCKAMTYRKLGEIETIREKGPSTTKSFQLSQLVQNKSRPTLSFSSGDCTNKNIVMVKCDHLECGLRPQVLKQTARIVGGGNAGLGAWPWQAALYKEGEFQCGGTLLSNRWLVSAGHCFFHSLDEFWVARLGALRRGTSLPSPFEQLRAIVKIILHPSYVDAGFINDISLLKMETAVVFSDYVRPICLPSPGNIPKDNTICTIIGWGQLFEVGRIFPDTLQEVQVPVISTNECREKTLFLPLYKVTEDMFCAGFERGGRDACLGDSGGPLMCPQSDGRWMLHGVTSNGYGCARANRPGVYTKVANYVPWIKSLISDNSNSLNISRNKTICTGHRCPLGECLPKSRLCNGYIECSDGSDERYC